MLTVFAGLMFAARLSTTAPDTAGAWTPSGIWYRVTGEGPAVLLVHGANLDSRSMAPLASALVRSHRVIEVDLRLHGKSRDGTGPFAFDGDILDVLRAAGVERATIIGHSLGAAVAIDLALSAPSRVERLVLLGPSINGKAATRMPVGLEAVIKALQANDMQQAAVALGSSPVFRLMGDTTLAALARQVVAENMRLFRADRGRLLAPARPAFTRLEEITVPVLVLTGSLDPTEASDAARDLLARVKGAQGETLAGCGHMLPMDCVPDVLRILARFLDISGARR